MNQWRNNHFEMRRWIAIYKFGIIGGVLRFINFIIIEFVSFSMHSIEIYDFIGIRN